jgi:SOS response regulatory protein OraA/RecX
VHRGSDDDPGGSPARRVRRRPSLAERRAERAAVDDPEVVLAAGLRFLETRSRSVTEVRRRLTQAGYREDLVEGAISRLLDIGILDDEVFGRLWIESRDRARPRGERALRQELALKGLDRQLVDQLLGERSAAAPDGAEPDDAAALRVLGKHARALARVADPRQRRQRAYALLARNGFDPETCTTTVRRFMEGGGDGEA